MRHQKLCDDEVRLRQTEHSGQLRKAIGAYSIGVRTTDVVDMLAICHVWATNVGQWIPTPVNYDRSTWTDILNSLVLERLGDHRCLDCGDFFPAAEHLRYQYGYGCPECTSEATEPIQCIEGVTR